MTTQEIIAHPVTSVVLFIVAFLVIYYIVAMADTQSKQRY